MYRNYTKNEAMKDLPVIDDKNLRDAVSLGIWLYLERGWTFRSSVNKAAQKHHIKPRTKVESLMRVAIPEEVILSRSLPRGKKRKPISPEKVIGNQRIKNMEKQAISHLQDI